MESFLAVLFVVLVVLIVGAAILLSRYYARLQHRADTEARAAADRLAAHDRVEAARQARSAARAARLGSGLSDEAHGKRTGHVPPRPVPSPRIPQPTPERAERKTGMSPEMAAPYGTPSSWYTGPSDSPAPAPGYAGGGGTFDGGGSSGDWSGSSSSSSSDSSSSSSDSGSSSSGD